jgi:hypothetical protein
MNWIKQLSILFVFTCSFTSCGIYSLSGVSIPPEIKTVSVAFIENKAPIIAPTLSPNLTDKLRDRFLTQTNLTMIEENGDFALSGYVTDYSVSPVGAADNSTASKNRLKITVKMTMVSEKAKKLEFDQQFSQFEDFDANQSLADVESTLIESITDNLAQEIFNKAALNW